MSFLFSSWVESYGIEKSFHLQASGLDTVQYDENHPLHSSFHISPKKLSFITSDDQIDLSSVESNLHLEAVGIQTSTSIPPRPEVVMMLTFRPSATSIGTHAYAINSERIALGTYCTNLLDRIQAKYIKSTVTSQF